MGGHTHTYTDPKTKRTVDYGVVVFENIPTVSDYFNYLGIPWIQDIGFPKRVTKYFNFSTNKIVNTVTATNPQNGFQAYATQLAKYPQISKGFFLPNPIPDDLLLPFGEFVSKYSGISNALRVIFTYSQGLGDFLSQPTLYVFKALGLSLVKGMVDGFIVTKNNNNMEIYNKAYKMLKDNVLLESYLIHVVRNATNGVEVTVMTPKGLTLIKAKKLLVSIHPTLSFLRGFDLNPEETKLFSQFQSTGYYTGLVRNTGLYANTSVENANTKNPYEIPTLPGLYAILPTAVDGLYDFKYGSPVGQPDAEVKAQVLKSFSMLQQSGIAQKTHGPEIVEFRNHAPFELTVPVKAIKAGFYEKLYALQGKQKTFWTGAAFHCQNSGLLWQFTNDFVLPPLIKEL